VNGAFNFTYSDAAGACPAGYRSVRFKKLTVKGAAWQTTLND
jgi:hypothetical protein